MPSFAQSMRLFEQLLQGNHLEQVEALLRDLLDADGRVRFKSIVAFHDHLCRRFGFVLRENSTQFVRPGGRHLFYVNGPLLIRVKTSGTKFRPEPHMTVSLAEGLGWPEEAAKFNRLGQMTPRVGAVPAAATGGMWRHLQRLGDTSQAILDSDDRWADSCHFNFVRGFDDSGAPGLHPIPETRQRGCS